jgi:hypothetical protein
MTEGHLHPYKSLKNSDKIISYHPPLKEIRSEFWKQAGTLSGAQQPGTDHRIWYVIRRYKA